MAMAESGDFVEMAMGGPLNYGHLVDAAKQQTELIVWMAGKLQEHERKLQNIERTLPNAGMPPGSQWKRGRLGKTSSDHSRVTTAGEDGTGAPSEFPSTPPETSEFQAVGVPVFGASASITEEGGGDFSGQYLSERTRLSEPVFGARSELNSSESKGRFAMATEDGDPRASVSSVGENLRMNPASPTSEGTPRGTPRLPGSAPWQPSAPWTFGATGSDREAASATTEGRMDLKLEDFAKFIQEELAQMASQNEEALRELAQEMQQRLGDAGGAPTLTAGYRSAGTTSQNADRKLSAGSQPSRENAGHQADFVLSAEGVLGSTERLSQDLRPGSPLTNMGGLDSQEQLAMVREMTQALQKKMDLVHVDELKDIRLEHVAVKADVSSLLDNVKVLANCLQQVPEVLADGHSARGLSAILRGGVKGSKTSRGSSKQTLSSRQTGRSRPAIEGGEPLEEEYHEEASSSQQEETEQNPETERPDSVTDTFGEVETFVPVTSTTDEEAQRQVAQVAQELKALQDEYKLQMRSVNHKLQHVEKAVRQDQEDQHRLFKAWNLANQVDVIQSVCAEEMRYVKEELKKDMKAAGFPHRHGHGDSAHASSDVQMPQSPKAASEMEGHINELSEKLRRLQENYQQNTLKIAGLKSAVRAIEHTSTTALEKAKKVTDEIDAVAEAVQRQDIRLDVLYREGLGSRDEVGLDAGGCDTGLLPVEGLERKVSNEPRTLARNRSTESLNAENSQQGTSPRGTAPRARGRRRSMAASVANEVQQGQQREGEDPGVTSGGETAGRRMSLSGGVGTGDEGITARFVRLGKKVTDLQGETTSELAALKTSLTLATTRLHMMESFLPKRQRRLVEKIIELDLDKDTKDREKLEEEEEAQEKKEKEKKSKKEKKDKLRNEGKKFVEFRGKDRLAETKEYQVEDEGEMPWQRVGEPDPKWNWCFQPHNEMGRDLALHFETMEDERQEFEEEMRKKFEELLQNGVPVNRARSGRRRTAASAPEDSEEQTEAESPTVPASPSNNTAEETLVGTDFGALGGSVDRVNKRLDKVILPQLTELTDRMDRMAAEVKEQKRTADQKLEAKADKKEVQVVSMRLSVFDDMDPTKLESRLTELEANTKYLEQVHDKLSMQVRKAESGAVSKGEVTKIWQEVSGMKVETQKVQKSVSDVSGNMFNSNQKIAMKIDDTSKRFEKELSALQNEKAMSKDLDIIAEKVRQLDIAIRASNKALSEGNGPEVNVVLKRIILGMEDKLMMLENKIQAMAEGKDILSEAFNGSTPATPSPPGNRAARPPSKGASVSPELRQEIEQTLQTVQKLKQDVGISKADLEVIKDQFNQHVELAQRITVLVEGVTDDENEDDSGSMLSLSRVQVMIAAAARQLVAGSKWITKDTFDLRLGEMRKEQQANARQLMTYMEELIATSSKTLALPALHGAGGGLLPKVVDAKRAGPLAGTTLQLQYVDPERTVQSARGPVRKQDQNPQVSLPLTRPNVRKLVGNVDVGAGMPWPGR